MNWFADLIATEIAVNVRDWLAKKSGRTQKQETKVLSAEQRERAKGSQRRAKDRTNRRKSR